jgi:hypothetical protein
MRGIFVALLFGVIACGGGSSEGPPGPLSKHLDDKYIAAIPLDQMKAVLEAQQQWNISSREVAKAEADLDESATQLQVAKNERSSAHNTVESAVSQKKSAESSADTNRINNAQRDLAAAEDLENAAKARVKYIEVYRGYLNSYLRYTQENNYYLEAQYEAAKAQVAKQNNIAPRGVALEAFPKQIDERAKRVQRAKQRAENEKVKAVNTRNEWISRQSSADKQAGKQSSFWDPMAPKTGPASAGNASGNSSVVTDGGGGGGGAGSAAPAQP